MPAPTYRVSLRNPHDVKTELCRLWRDNLSPTTSPEERFDWLYRDAPHSNFTVVVLEAVDAESARIVGANGMVPRSFWVSGREVPAVVSCDFSVDRAHRSLQPALSLLRAFRENVKAHAELVYGLPNAKAEAVLKRAGFTEVGRAQRWVKVLRYAHYVPRLEQEEASFAARLARSNPAVATGVLKVFDMLRVAWHGLRHSPRTHGVDVCVQSAPDERWDTLWLAAREEFKVVGARTAAFLRWRCAFMPGALFVALQGHRDHQLRAYAIVQINPTTGAAHVRDLFGHRSELGPLIDQLTPLAYRAGASSLSVRFLGAPDVERHLATAGFVPRGGSRSVVTDLAPSLDAGVVADVHSWHLFDVDEDS